MADGQTIDKPTLVNRALAEIGQPPKYSTDGETAFGQVVELVWPRVIDKCFGLHDWSFCRRTLKLARHAAKPANGWTYGFDLPGDRIGPPLKVLRSADERDVLRHYDIEAGALYAHEKDLWARCKVALSPEAWDAGFRDAFVTALAAELAVPMTQDIELRNDLRREAFGTPSEGMAGGKFGRIIAQDLAGQPVGSPLLRDDPLTSARYM